MLSRTKKNTLYVHCTSHSPRWLSIWHNNFGTFSFISSSSFFTGAIFQIVTFPESSPAMWSQKQKQKKQKCFFLLKFLFIIFLCFNSPHMHKLLWVSARSSHIVTSTYVVVSVYFQFIFSQIMIMSMRQWKMELVWKKLNQINDEFNPQNILYIEKDPRYVQDWTLMRCTFFMIGITKCPH